MGNFSVGNSSILERLRSKWKGLKEGEQGHGRLIWSEISEIEDGKNVWPGLGDESYFGEGRKHIRESVAGFAKKNRVEF